MEDKNAVCVWEFAGDRWFTSCGMQKTPWAKFELFMANLDVEPICPLCHCRIKVVEPKKRKKWAPAKKT